MGELQRLNLIDDTRKFNAPNAEEIKRLQTANAAARVRRIANALDLWAEGSDHAHNLAEQYLRSRGITITLPPTIRAHAPIRHSESGEMRPAMLALVEHVGHGPVGVHCTYLRFDGRGKATVTPDKKSFGPVGGAAARLSMGRMDGWLVVGEGIESTLSAMQLWHCKSGWAALSATGLRNLVLPPEAQRLVIAVDNDLNGVGQAAARDAACIWQREGRTVRVALPPTPNSDFNDILMGRF